MSSSLCSYLHKTWKMVAVKPRVLPILLPRSVGDFEELRGSSMQQAEALTTQWHPKMTMPYLSWWIFITFYAFTSSVLLSFMVSRFLLVSYHTANYSYLSLLKSSDTGILDVLIWPATMFFPPLFFIISFLLAFHHFCLLSYWVQAPGIAVWEWFSWKQRAEGSMQSQHWNYKMHLTTCH